MAQWKETQEPYVKVHEKIRTASVNPTAGENLIIGGVIVSDAGPSVPTLITSQAEFIATYSSQDLTKGYVESLNKLYKGDDHTMAETMWLNAYRLAGSNNLLLVRASKASDIFFAKPLVKDDNSVYIVRDGQLLKKVPEFKLVVDVDKDSADHNSDGWAVSINGVGSLGNRTTDEGPQYDYYVQNLKELVSYLNDTSIFFSPSYTLYEDEKAEVVASDPKDAVSVVFHEVYVGVEVLDKSDKRGVDGLAYVVICEKDWTPENPGQKIVDLNSAAFSGFKPAKNYAVNNYNSSTPLKVRIRRFNHDAVITKELSKADVNSGGNSPYTVLTTVLDTFTKNGTISPKADVLDRDFYEVAVIDPSVSSEPVYFNVGKIAGRGDVTVDELNKSLKMIQLQLPDDLSDLGLDYFGYLPKSKQTGWMPVKKDELESGDLAKVKAYDSKLDMKAATASVGDVAVVGKKSVDYYEYKTTTTRDWQLYSPSGTEADSAQEYTDLTTLKAVEGTDGQYAKLNESGQVTYYKCTVTTSEPGWVKMDTTGTANYDESSLASLNEHIVKPKVGDIAKVGTESEGKYFKYQKGITLDKADPEELHVSLGINPEKYSILNVSDSDIMKAFDRLALDEVYQTEGLADFGCTSPAVQSYMANLAINENYFYPVSTVNSTNYLAIANSANKLSKDSYKLYVSAPWDVDSGTVGFKYYAAPSTLYWEAVGRNRGLDREFAPIIGQTNGVVQYQKPVTEFNKKTRQLLLSKKINTVMWNNQSQAWNMNDNYTKQSEDNIMSDEANSRLFIRLSKSFPKILRQFIGRRIGETLYSDMESALDFFFRTEILSMSYTVDAYQITIASINNDELARQNKVRVLVEVRYPRSLKFVEVYNEAYDMGMPFEGNI